LGIISANQVISCIIFWSASNFERIFMGTFGAYDEALPRNARIAWCGWVCPQPLLEGESVTLRSGSKGGRRRVARGIAIGRGTARARAVTSCQWSAKTINHLWLVQILVL
jgi:hypothetical protein